MFMQGEVGIVMGHKHPLVEEENHVFNNCLIETGWKKPMLWKNK
jgi:hypothetical protein